MFRCSPGRQNNSIYAVQAGSSGTERDNWRGRTWNVPDAPQRWEISVFSRHNKDVCHLVSCWGEKPAFLCRWLWSSSDVPAGAAEEELAPFSIPEQSHYLENKRQEMAVCCCSHSFSLGCWWFHTQLLWKGNVMRNSGSNRDSVLNPAVLLDYRSRQMLL